MALHTSQKKYADYVPPVNSYVPGMTYAADIGEDGVFMCDFGTPPATATTGIITTMAQDAAVDVRRSSFDSTTAYRAAARWGACVSLVGTSTNTAAVSIYGRDCYGQPMKETLTLNSATPVPGVKAFKTIDRVTCGVSASDTFSLGWSTVWGFPYKTVAVIAEIADGVLASAGTLVGGVLTDPQTATTGDPRGRYTPTTTADGAKNIRVLAVADNSVSATGTGGLMGYPHYNAA